MVEIYRERFSGWSGVIFICDLDDTNDALQKGVCGAATQEARYLAAIAGIDFEAVEPNDWGDAAFRAAYRDALTLVTVVRATEEGSFRSIYVALQAQRFMERAVEQGEHSGVDASPRSGDLVLWNGDVIGHGAGSELQVSVSSSFATILREFFATYLEAQKSKQ